MKTLCVMLTLSSLALADTKPTCDQLLGLCNSYTSALVTNVSEVKKERDDLKQANTSCQSALLSAQHPLIPAWAIFGVGFLVGAVGLRLVTK